MMMREKKQRKISNINAKDVFIYVILGLLAIAMLVAIICMIVILYQDTKSYTTEYAFQVEFEKVKPSVYRHKQTGVYYIVSSGGVCVIVNADGTPYTGEDNKGD